MTLGVYGIQDRMDTQYPQYVHDHNITIADKGKITNFLQLEKNYPY